MKVILDKIERARAEGHSPFLNTLLVDIVRTIEWARARGDTQLDLPHQMLHTLPESIGTFTNLQLLNLSNNELSTLPESIGALSNLQFLRLNYNLLVSLPESIGGLSNLQELYLDHNRLSHSLRVWVPSPACNSYMPTTTTLSPSLSAFTNAGSCRY